MPRVSLQDSAKYSSGSGLPYFTLANDKDTARVRFMFESMEDLNDTNYVCHEVEVGDKKKYVNCLREYNDPKDACPFCAANIATKQVLFIPLYDVDEDKVKVWQRSAAFATKKFPSLLSRYKNFPSHIFEIERNGVKGDQRTTYELFEQDDDDTTLQDLPEIPDLEALGMILDKSAEDMEYYLEEETFPPEDDEDVKPRRSKDSRRSRNDDEEEEVRPRRTEDRGRRTAVKDKRRNREDTF